MSNRGTVLTLATVKENKSNYSDQDCNRARTESKLQETMGNISTKDLLYMIYKILIPKCPITRDDFKAANYIFGTIVKALKFKTLHK